MEFAASVEELFDIAHEDAMTMMVIEEDKQFLHLQRQGRKGCMGRIDKELAEREQRKQERREAEERRILREKEDVKVIRLKHRHYLIQRKEMVT